MNQKRVADVATRLEEAMMLSDKKQIDLVRLTGLDGAAINRYLKGVYEPKPRALRKLAIALNVSDMWLWGYDVPRERTAIHNKNDKMIKIMSKMKKDEDFFALVETLSELSPEQYESIKQLLVAFTNK